MNPVYCVMFTVPVGLAFGLLFASLFMSGVVYVAFFPEGAVCTLLWRPIVQRRRHSMPTKPDLEVGGGVKQSRDGTTSAAL